MLLLLVMSVMSDSVWPHRWQPTRLPRPWDSPGKNTGVGCHLLLQCRKVKRQSEVAQSCLTLCNPMDCSLPGSSAHGIFQARVLKWGAIAFSSQIAIDHQTLWNLLSLVTPLVFFYPILKSLHSCFSNSVVRDQFLNFSHSVADYYINEI